MPSLTYDALSGAYFVLDALDEHLALLTELRWRPHPDRTRCWWTRSPYLAAPFWAWVDARDEVTRASLGPFAWNYATSFAREPIQGTGVDAIRLPAGARPYPFQIAGVQRIMLRKRLLLGDDRGTGKQQPVDAPVLTPLGWRPIGALRPGDAVTSSDGGFSIVTGVFPQGVKPVYRVHFSDGSSTEAGGEHLWSVTYWRGGRTRTTMTLTTDQIRLRPRVGRLSLSGIKLSVPMLSGPVRFWKTASIPVPPYTLGQIVANGATSGSGTVLTSSFADADEVLSHIRSEGIAVGSSRRYENIRHTGILGVRHLTRALNLDVKSGAKFIPRQYVEGPPYLRLAVLQGMMDGDGSVSAARNKVSYSTTSERLAHDVVELVEGLGGIASVRRQDRHHHGKSIEFAVRIRMPPWAPPFRLRRKLARYAPGKNGSPSRTVDKVEFSRDAECVCISVSATDRLYVTDHCILTHNTFQSLAAINLLRPRRVLIGCPAFLVDNWAKEAERWLVDPRSITILGRGKKAAPGEGVLILPFSKGHRFADSILAGAPIEYLIADQVEQLKDPDARRSRPWLGEGGLFERAERVVATTGSPIPNNPLEVHGLLAALSPEMRVSRDAFKESYCSTFRGVAKVATRSGGETAVEFEKNSGKHEAALNAELRASGTMVRRLKVDVLEQLPPKRVFLVHLTPTAAIEELVREELTLYEQLQAKLLTSQEMISLQGHIANVRARLGLLKAPKIVEYLRWIIEGGETRVVLFMLHLAAIEEVRKSFDGTRVKVRVLSGAQSPRERDDHVTEFQKPGGCEIVIGQIKAAGLGLTMTASRIVVMGELSWTPTDNSEAIDRCWRISQERAVEAPVLTWPDAVEERVLQSNAAKAISAQKILDDNLQKMVT